MSELLLAEHVPVLVYDSLEWCFVAAAEQWLIDGELRRADGTVIARPPQLTLEFLRPGAYANGEAVLPGDVIGHSSKDYTVDYSRVRVSHPEFNDVVYGRVVLQDGVMWLQYWFFYYYNGYHGVIGGLHEGDWEMVMVRLDDDAPDLMAFAQHRVGQARPWEAVHKIGSHPVVYVARGSHASFPTPGQHGTDRADGCRWSGPPRLEVVGDDTHAWMRCAAHWGDTANSPVAPGRKRQWKDPNGWLKALP